MQQSDFETMARRWRRRALEASQAAGAPADEAEDVAQDTLLKLWAMRGELERYRSVEALSATIARHLTIDRHRRRRTVPIEEAGLEAAVVEATDDGLISRENDRWLQQRLEQLPPRQHTVLVMRQVEHRSYDEIASLLGIEPASAKVLLSRARKWLLNQLKNDNLL